MSSNKIPHGIELKWTWTADKIKTATDDMILKSKLVHDKVGGLKYEDVDYDTVVKPLANDAMEYEVHRSNVVFIQQVFTDKQLRDVSVQADKKLSEFDVEMSMRQDVFDTIVTFFEKCRNTLDADTKRWAERLITLGRKNGLHLSKEIQDKVKEIKKRISELCIEFSKNINEYNPVIELTTEELVGMPESFLNSLEKTEDGKHKVTLKYPHYFPIMKKAHNPEVRKKMEFAFQTRCIKENIPILEEVLKLRHEKAVLLGFKTHAESVLDIRMAKNPEAVQKFYARLIPKLKVLLAKDMEAYKKYKELMCNNRNFECDGKINKWDIRYCMNLLKEREYAIDEDKLREYFPLSHVTDGLFHIYQKLLSLNFKKVENAEVWHPDVSLYSVRDAVTDELFGYFYLDLFPRNGKYSHAACFGLQEGCENMEGGRRIAVSAMVANMTIPTAGKPSLLAHDEVETYFHEFGHVMHQICTRAKYILFSGSNVERDFVEAPSQMLENWVWEKEPLHHMSKHYETGQPIPDELIENLKKSKKANAAIFNLRQILIGQFDQIIHTQSEADTTKILEELSLDLMEIPNTPGTNFASAFNHVVSGYDAQYYGYLWSEVFSMDMFATRFKKEGIMNPVVGKDYRNLILAPGGSLDADEMLRNFLGREPNEEAFLISKGF